MEKWGIAGLKPRRSEVRERMRSAALFLVAAVGLSCVGCSGEDSSSGKDGGEDLVVVNVGVSIPFSCNPPHLPSCLCRSLDGLIDRLRCSTLNQASTRSSHPLLPSILPTPPSSNRPHYPCFMQEDGGACPEGQLGCTPCSAELVFFQDPPDGQVFGAHGWSCHAVFSAVGCSEGASLRLALSGIPMGESIAAGSTVESVRVTHFALAENRLSLGLIFPTGSNVTLAVPLPFAWGGMASAVAVGGEGWTLGGDHFLESFLPSNAEVAATSPDVEVHVCPQVLIDHNPHLLCDH